MYPLKQSLLKLTLSMIALFLFSATHAQVKYTKDWQSLEMDGHARDVIVDDQSNSYVMSNKNYASFAINHFDNHGNLRNSMELLDYFARDILLVDQDYIYVLATHMNNNSQNYLAKFHRNTKNPIFVKQIDLQSATSLRYKDGFLYAVGAINSSERLLKKMDMSGNVITSKQYSTEWKSFEYEFDEYDNLIFTYYNKTTSLLSVDLLAPSDLSVMSTYQKTYSSPNITPTAIVSDNNEIFVSVRENVGTTYNAKIISLEYLSPNQINYNYEIPYRRADTNPSFPNSTHPYELQLNEDYAFLSLTSQSRNASGTTFRHNEILRVDRTNQNTLIKDIGTQTWSNSSEAHNIQLVSGDRIYSLTNRTIGGYLNVFLRELDLNLAIQGTQNINTSAYQPSIHNAKLERSECEVFALFRGYTNLSPAVQGSSLMRFSFNNCPLPDVCQVESHMLNTQNGLNLNIYPNEKFNKATALESYTLDMGDGNIYTTSDFDGEEINHLYSQPGTYTVCLTVEGATLTGDICTDQYCETIEIKCFEEGECQNQYVKESDKSDYFITENDAYAFTANEDLLFATGKHDNAQDYKGFVSRISSGGFHKWAFSFEDQSVSGLVRATSVIESSNGDILVTGITNIENSQKKTYNIPFFLRLNADGELQFFKTFDFNWNTKNSVIRELNQNGYMSYTIICSGTNKFGIFNIDEFDTFTYSKDYALADNANLEINDFVIRNNGTSNQELYVLGNKFDGFLSVKPMVIKFDGNAQLLDIKYYSSHEASQNVSINSVNLNQIASLKGMRILELNSSELVIVGKSSMVYDNSFVTKFLRNGMVFKIDSQLNLIGNKIERFENSTNSAYDIVQFQTASINNSKLYLGGNIQELFSSVEDKPTVTALNISNLTVPIQSKAYPASNPSQPNATTAITNIHFKSNGQMIASGYASSGNQMQSSLYLLKTNSSGNLETDCTVDGLALKHETISASGHSATLVANSTANDVQFNDKQLAVCDIDLINKCVDNSDCTPDDDTDPCANFNPDFDFDLYAEDCKAYGIRLSIAGDYTKELSVNGAPITGAWDHITEPGILNYFFNDEYDGSLVVCIKIIDESGCEKEICKDLFLDSSDPVVEDIEHTICCYDGNIKWYQPEGCGEFDYYTLDDPNPNDWYDYDYDSRDHQSEDSPCGIIAHALKPGYTYSFNFYDKYGCLKKTTNITILCEEMANLGDVVIEEGFCPINGNGRWIKVCDLMDPLPENFLYTITDPDPSDWNDYNYNSDENSGECIHHFFIEGTYEIEVFDKETCTVYKIILSIYPDMSLCDHDFTQANETQSVSAQYEELNVYPNPSTGTINIDGHYENGAKYSLLNSNYQVITKGEFEKGSRNNSLNFDQVSTGLYMLLIESNQTVKRVNIILVD